jgi:hypothetical protein
MALAAEDSAGVRQVEVLVLMDAVGYAVVRVASVEDGFCCKVQFGLG